MSRQILMAVLAMVLLPVFGLARHGQNSDDKASKKALVMTFYAAMNAHDPAAFDRSLAPEWTNDPPHPGEKAGRDGWKPVAQSLFTAFPDIHVTVEDMLVDGDRVAARIRMAGTQQGEFMGFAATGKHMDIRVVDFFEVRNGRITKTWHVEDWLTAMKQLNAAVGDNSSHRKQ